MKNYKWSTQYQPIDQFKGEKNDLPSQTIPNEAMSIREILVRYARGLPIDGKVPLYDEANDLPDPRKLDLAEIQELREQYQAEIAEIKAKQEKYQSEQKRKEEEEKNQFKQFKEFMEQQARQGGGGPAESPRPTGLPSSGP